MTSRRSRSAEAAPVWRLHADCPWCHAPLVLKRRRVDGKPFLSCAAYPGCDFTEDYHPELLHYVRPNDRTLAQLREDIRQLTAERDDLRWHLRLERQRTAPPSSPPASSAERQALVKDLTRMLTVCHPDRWGGESAVAHELTKHLVSLRDRLKEGTR